ncbi:polysaccharide biosynthesis tyrosine autokinase [Muriicola sp. Z0-33]|uniref:polysaccharide biosynthesis tyrosine autokinase n=1 Tax=Muriicola sp. Z0-33 TaxID=2816957 RepID=UPI002238A8CD|nr:tyrosine-protein kinase family protein [Muriicola sp. Z0-33]MCW5516905.1 polysaccharide biosynthesis tyrosine autokinase [Muriicola sp. Z0-33]
MKESQISVDFIEKEDAFTLKDAAGKYLYYWPLFLGVVLLSVVLGFLYMRYAPITYESVAKIKIIDDEKETNIASEALAKLEGSSTINLENEIEVLKSYRILSQVVRDLRLDIDYYQVGNVKTSQIWNPPFVLTKPIIEDSIRHSTTYSATIGEKQLTIANSEGREAIFSYDTNETAAAGFPFEVSLAEDIDIKNYLGLNYKIILQPIKEAVMQLNKSLHIRSANENSEILYLSIKGTSVDRSESILNSLIAKFDEDGILDRQLVSKRTLEVIDRRFAFLAGELDSIEIGKEDFKRTNSLSYIESDADNTLQRKSDTEDEVFKLENQISLSKILKETVINQVDYSLFPADIGLENSSLNGLVNNYNTLALEREKLLPNVGVNHPTLRALSEQLERGKVNIIKSVNVYQAQLRSSLRRLNQEKSIASAQFSGIPEKEKMLRAIERQQRIKENLYLLLLEKREEAAINLAATSPSIKVVDYALTSNERLSPNSIVVYPVAVMLGLLAPFLLLFVRFSLDTKVRERADISKLGPEVPIAAEIPRLKKGKRVFSGTTDRSVLAESFRILTTNVNYLMPENKADDAKVIYVTSSIKGEGKTMVALNLSLAYASLKKNVLLIGADFRNPQLHQYLHKKKPVKGLADYLTHRTLDWREFVQPGIGDNGYHKVCFSRTIPPNATELLSGKGFKKFIEQARKEFDYIILDTAPTVLVTDTFLISEQADMTLFLLRSGHTEKRLLEFTKELKKNNRLKNMAFVLNGVGQGKSRSYNYGYGYGYGSNEHTF